MDLEKPAWHVLRQRGGLKLWGLEVQRLIYGKRRTWEFRYGGPGECLAALVADSEDVEAAEIVLAKEIEAFFSRWRSYLSADSDVLLRAVEVIQAFQPESGLAILFDLTDNGILGRKERVAFESKPVDMQERVLAAMSSYFRYPPIANSQATQQAFAVYLEILCQACSDSSLSGYALSRLLELETPATCVSALKIERPRDPAPLRLVYRSARTERRRSELFRLLERCFGEQFLRGIGISKPRPDQFHEDSEVLVGSIAPEEQESIEKMVEEVRRARERLPVFSDEVEKVLTQEEMVEMAGCP